MRTQCLYLSSSELTCCMCREHTACVCVLIYWHEHTVCLCSDQQTTVWVTETLCCVLCALINRPAVCVMSMLYLCSYRLTCCMCHRKSLFLCSNHLTCCVGHQHTVLSGCILINWPDVWVMSRLCCVFLSADLLYGSRKHCVCVQINWPAVWVMNTQCCAVSYTHLTLPTRFAV